MKHFCLYLIDEDTLTGSVTFGGYYDSLGCRTDATSRDRDKDEIFKSVLIAQATCTVITTMQNSGCDELDIY
jgi:hypothetical protein